MGKDGSNTPVSSKGTDKLTNLRSQRTQFENHIRNLHGKIIATNDQEDADTLDCRLQILESHYRQITHIKTFARN